MLCRAFAKINLGLDVTGVREDGYHLLRMVMQSVDLCDDVLIEKSSSPGIRLAVNGAALPADETNLAYRAAALLLEEFPQTGGVSVTLEKRIPLAAGLAGGSADAAAVLTGMNRLFGLQLTGEELEARALRLGADVPYCVRRGTALAEGIGEELTPLPDLPACTILLAKPDAEVSTAGTYRAVDSLSGFAHPDIDGICAALRKGALAELAGKMGNVLELVTIPVHPEIGQIRQRMLRAGALGARMSGSGPTVFGIFADRRDAAAACEDLNNCEAVSWTCMTEAGSGRT